VVRTLALAVTLWDRSWTDAWRAVIPEVPGEGDFGIAWLTMAILSIFELVSLMAAIAAQTSRISIVEPGDNSVSLLLVGMAKTSSLSSWEAATPMRRI